MKWLVTAFGPFDGAQSNSSLNLCHRLEKGQWRGQVEFHSPVPVSFSGAWPDVRSCLDQDPEIHGVLALGQAEGRAKITLERIALNWIDARIADNVGEQPVDVRIEAGGPELLWSSIPWERAPGFKACELSYSAGTFVCNALMYQVLQWASKAPHRRGGFVHVPVLRSQLLSEPSRFGALTSMDDNEAEESLEELLHWLIDL